MPKVDMDMTSGRIAAWHAAEGDRVEKAAPLFDIETDKAAMEVESPASGILRRVLAPAGAEVAIGQPVAWIFAEGEAEAAPEQVPMPMPMPEPVPMPGAGPAADPDAAGAAAGVRATPLARALARRHGLALAEVVGTGARGRIQAQDVARAVALLGRITEPAVAVAVEPVTQPARLVLLHGFAADAASWAKLLPRLPPGQPVVTLELPGHGAAPAAPAASFADMVSEVARAFDGLGGEPVHLVGHSLGGAVALALADLRPRAVARLTLIAPAGLGPEIDAAVLLGLARASRAESLAPWLRALTADPDAIGWGFVQAAMLRRADPALRARQAALADALFPDGVQAFDVAPALARVAMPARIIWGRQDRVLPWRHALRAPGRVSLNLFEACGHLPHLEQAEAVALLLAGPP